MNYQMKLSYTKIHECYGLSYITMKSCLTLSGEGMLWA